MKKHSHQAKINQLTVLNRGKNSTAISLIGRTALLPAKYTEETLEQLQRNDTSLFDFYTIFNTRISALVEAMQNLANQSAPSLYNIDREYFYYLALYACNLRSKQALKQWISGYFDLDCYCINTTLIKINFSRPNNSDFKLGKNSLLGSLLPTNTLLVNLYFNKIALQHYQELIQQSPFFLRLRQIIEFALSATTRFKLHFKIHSHSAFQSKLSNSTHLGINAWLGEIRPETQLTASWSELT